VNDSAALGIVAALSALVIINIKRTERPERAKDVSERSVAIIAWRAWQLETIGSEPWLRSVVVPVYWQRGAALEARYLPPPGATTYGAGIYAAKSRTGALKSVAGWPSGVYGTVALWGNVIEHSRGYRAQFAYPQHLWCKDQDTARALSRLYGCEADIGEPWSEMYLT
jgi:hypothetical protein